MSREEAIKELSYIIDEMPSMECADWIEAISMGIKTLEQEPCDDAISRDRAIVQLSHLLSDWDDDWNVAIRKCIETVKIVPPVTPAEKVGQWIPVSEKYPEENGRYLVTLRNGEMALGIWIGFSELWVEVTAWMPLPEPYTEGGEQE